MDGEIFCKPARLSNARNETQMLLLQRTPKAAGNEKIISRFPPPTRSRARFFNKSDRTYRNSGWPGCVARFAPDNAYIEIVCCPAQAAIKPLHPCHFGLPGKNKRNQRELRET